MTHCPICWNSGYDPKFKGLCACEHGSRRIDKTRRGFYQRALEASRAEHKGRDNPDVVGEGGDGEAGGDDC